jgi:hypothetical protein
MTRGTPGTQRRVCVFRNDHDIAVYRDGDRVERWLILHEAASRLSGQQENGGRAGSRKLFYRPSKVVPVRHT